MSKMHFEKDGKAKVWDGTKWVTVGYIVKDTTIMNNTITVNIGGSYEDRARAGNLSPQEIKDLYAEVVMLRAHNSSALGILRIIADSNSQFRYKVQAVLDRIEFGTDDTRVIEAAKKAIEFRNKVKGL